MAEERRAPELRPEIMFIFDLVGQLVDGRIRIPRFQRPFVWRRQQMVDLLDSIYSQYPIGSLLAWETDAAVVSLPSVGPIAFDRSKAATASYMLDGHQRLSTIAGALVQEKDRTASVGEDDPALWNLYYNAEENAFQHLEIGQMPRAYQFPMSKILDTFDFLAESQRVMTEGGEKGKRYLAKIQDVARAFQNYKIPVIQIKQTGLTEAVEIFARLNSKGQSMSADQMVSALLYREGDQHPFDLAREIDSSMSILKSYGFGDIDRTVVLRTLLAAVKEDIYRTDWTRVAITRREELQGRLKIVLPQVNTSLESAARFLSRQLHVPTDRLLPYAMQMTVIASFFTAQPEPSDEQLALLKRWFWVSSFTRWFGGANPSRVNALVRDFMDNVATSPEHPKLATFDLGEPAAAIPRSFDMRSARTRSLLLGLYSQKPRGRDGEVIKDPEVLVGLYGPEAIGYVAYTVSDSDLSRSPANRIPRDDPSERGQARNWLLELPGTVKEAVWRSHLLPIAGEPLLRAPDASSFIKLRLAAIQDFEKEFMRERGVVAPTTSTPSISPADAE
jgi:Protein of unknown function DUF262